jgi:hypothetical protein
MAVSDAAVDLALNVRAVAGERSHGSCHLVEQEAVLRAVIDIVRGQRRRDNLTGSFRAAADEAGAILLNTSRGPLADEPLRTSRFGRAPSCASADRVG